MVAFRVRMGRGLISSLLLLNAWAQTAVAFQVPHSQTPLRSTLVPSTKIVKPIIATSSTELASATSEGPTSPTVDYDALLKYHASIAVQMSLFAGLFAVLDTLVEASGITVPFPVVGALFYGLSLKSRIFNPLDNARPDLQKAASGDKAPTKGFRDRVMPSWTPPGIVFPIMWLLIIGPIRAYSSALVYETTGHFFNPAILAFFFHLSVGDVWNTINNTEKRYGAAVTGVLCVTASVVYAAYQYYTVTPLAGNLLGATVIWLSIASSLIAATWQLNPNPTTGERDALYPIVGDAKTEFSWFQGKD